MRTRSNRGAGEDFRSEIVGPWETNGGPSEIVDQLARFRFYIETLEKFISDQETAEVVSLETEAGKLNEKARGEFWARHYPVHWNEIFRTTLRSSFLISVMSFEETTVTLICGDVQIITRAKIGVHDLWGNPWVETLPRSFREFHGTWTRDVGLGLASLPNSQLVCSPRWHTLRER
jgi:hypothetical protein